MELTTCNLWLEPAEFRCIPISGALNSDGTAPMDFGLALEARQRYRQLEVDLGRSLSSRGNHVNQIRPGLLSFPVKQYAWAGVNLQIIERSGHELCQLVGAARTLLPVPCGANEEISMEDFAKVLSFLPDNIILIQHG